MSEVVLQMKNIIKDFPGVRALDKVNFEASKGEVLVLAGENGAGKSTLMKVLSGVWAYPSYEGDIYLKGQLVRFKNTKEAEAAGVAIIHQELNLIQDLTVAENVFLGRQPGKFGTVNWNEVNSRAEEILERLNIKGIKASDKVGSLTVGQQQMVEIAKALSINAEVLVFDEPTSALTTRETKELFRVINDLKKRDVCMIYISHKMDEFEIVGDRVQVLRDGQTIGEATKIKDTTLDEIITKMVGRDIKDMFPKVESKIGGKVLEVKNYDVDHTYLPGEKKVKNANFEVHAGEVVGMAGLMGAGRTELVTAIFGGTPELGRGEVYLDGKKLNIKSPKDAIEAGIALVTEDRKLFGLFLDKDIMFNTTTSSRTLGNISNSLGMINFLEARKITEKYVKEINVKTPGIDVPISNLSGGNQQKVIIGKWLATKPKVLILDEPTRGIDVGAKVEIYKLINKLAAEGVAIIMISSELPEVMGMSDRILVMTEGEIVANIKREEVTKEKVMAYATGNFREEM
ncbi:sugar ABC transporter ATP-binding protein [Haliovirga abyssi]|uniref:Xylose import ATP-binding protein XylG n=1 Tax=Haliovirga abyssi TaxID=2996794 RepID=A0AAU9D9A8_9FUSO|nr:sugar ABC transporter ATP-binding protein [Haliovirga abyssi]BDU49870.1 xylose import ATP-binding protein XylG [Haliovirga abyssi]